MVNARCTFFIATRPNLSILGKIVSSTLVPVYSVVHIASAYIIECGMFDNEAISSVGIRIHEISAAKQDIIDLFYECFDSIKLFGLQL